MPCPLHDPPPTEIYPLSLHDALPILTHRCHDRQFLFRFAKDRDGYRRRLREAIGSVGASLLTYNITSNHVDRKSFGVDSRQVTELFDEAAWDIGSGYVRRK